MPSHGSPPGPVVDSWPGGQVPSAPPSFIASLPPVEPATAQDGHADRIAGLREISRRLRVAAADAMTFQYVIDQACACTRATSGRLVVGERTFVSGRMLRAGPRVHATLQVDGRVLGGLEVTRRVEDDAFDVEDESFVELVADYVARAVCAAREGTALEPSARDFVEGVSDELRAPLAALTGLVRTALAGPVGEETAAALRGADAHCTQLTAMAEDLILLARLRTPAPEERRGVAVGQWLAAGVEARRADAAARGLELSLRVEGEGLRVSGAPELLERAIDHLIGNALKFSHAGGRVEVAAMGYGSNARITVRDDGVGFEPTDAARVFGRFERSPTEGAEHLVGAGLGLALVHEIAEAHGGRVAAQTTLGQGTQVLLTLPLAE